MCPILLWHIGKKNYKTKNQGGLVEEGFSITTLAKDQENYVWFDIM
jgi:hypothetical protein